MRDAARQLADRLHLLRLAQLRFELGALLLDPPALGQVPDHREHVWLAPVRIGIVRTSIGNRSPLRRTVSISPW